VIAAIDVASKTRVRGMAFVRMAPRVAPDRGALLRRCDGRSP
jgi:hypothetical protein